MSKLKSPAALAAILAVVLVAVIAAWALSEGFGDDDDDDLSTVTTAAAQTATEAPDDDMAVADEPVVDADDVPIEPAELKRVEAAAVRIAGGGQVTGVDRSDDPGEAFEVEVITDAGEVDVALDEDLRRVPNATYDD